jgi:ABC-2 type transport system permease protein
VTIRGLSKYAVGFRMALSLELAYRAEFVIKRLQELIVYSSLLFLYGALPGAGVYDTAELRTYALLAALLNVTLATYHMGFIADEIVHGDLASFLLRPINYLGYWLSRATAVRFVHLIFGVAELALLRVLFSERSFFVQTEWKPIVQALALFIGSIAIMQVIDFLAGVVAFWAGRSYGFRFGVEGIIVPLLSGAFVPLDLFPEWTQRILNLTPFPSLVFGPLKAYLGDLPGELFWRALATQAVWLIVLGGLLAIMWRRGVKSYEATGN